MELQRLDLGEAYRLIGHGPTVLVSTYDAEQVPNACAVAWAIPASKQPPRFALRIGERHKTYANLMQTQAAVINLPTVAALEQVMLCGRNSGHGGDKLTPAGITTSAGQEVAAPRLDCCAAWIECALLGELKAQDTGLVLLEARLAECRPGVMTAAGHMDVERHPTLHHLGGGLFSVPGEIREHK